MKTLTIHGSLRLRWAMPKKPLLNFILLCLGRQRPEGGVVLGIDCIYDIIHMFRYIYIYIYPYFNLCKYIIVGGFILSMHSPL